MTRYEREFEGIPAIDGRPEGMDPNYRDGYRGMRMRAGGKQAAYGAHRLARRADLGSAGGFEGIHRAGRPWGYDDGRFEGREGREDRESREGEGGVRRVGDPEFLKGFDSRGIRYSGEDRRTDEMAD